MQPGTQADCCKGMLVYRMHAQLRFFVPWFGIHWEATMMMTERT